MIIWLNLDLCCALPIKFCDDKLPQDEEFEALLDLAIDQRKSHQMTKDKVRKTADKYIYAQSGC